MKNILFLFIVLVQFSLGQEADVQFEQANQLYRTGEYENATQAYEQVLLNGYEHAALYYNLGNSYFKLKNYPAAILNYERAKRLAPNDEELDHNIRLANLHVVDKIEPVPQLFLIEWWRASVNYLSTDGWALAGIVLLWATVLFGSLLLLIRSDILRRMCLLLAVVLFITSVLSFVGMMQRNALEAEEFAIVFSPSVSVKSAPDAQSTDLFVIHEGVKARVLDSVGEWKKIKLADGKVGWMPAGDFQVI
ncbi:MAG: tetratricopeptide repeat protein [Ignavibacteriae bacterium]|nr:tetratricopeptide repeat protein [Ignavibacteriota bacterium]